MLQKVNAEVARYKKFSRALLGESVGVTVNDIDVKDYVKFLLKDGTFEEKRAILSCITSQIVLSEKVVSLK